MIGAEAMFHWLSNPTTALRELCLVAGLRKSTATSPQDTSQADSDLEARLGETDIDRKAQAQAVAISSATSASGCAQGALRRNGYAATKRDVATVAP